MMKMRSVLLIVLLASFTKIFAGGYKISIQVKGAPKDSLCQLAYYYGDKKLLKDSARVGLKGTIVFQSDSVPLEKGIYLVVLNGKYFEFVSNDATEFTMKTDEANYVTNMSITGSPENVLFYDYLKFISPLGKEMDSLNTALKTAREKDPAAGATIIDRMKVIDQKMKDYKKNLITKNPTTLVASLFKSMEDIEIPERETWPDSTYGYQFYKAHYFDNIDFKDPRLIRTPVFQSKIDYYLDKLVVQHWDSLTKECDYLMGKVGKQGNKEMFKFMLIHLTRKYGDSKIMCMDEVPWYLYKNYFMEDKRVDWIDSTNMVKIKEEVIKKTYNLCGDVPPNVVFQDTTGKFHDLHKLQADYTILYFWSATCGHCKKATPKLWEYYQKVQDKGVKVFTVCIDKDLTPLKKYLNEHKFTWINAYDSDNANNFRVYYNVFSTPTIYILDKDKKIIGKKVDISTIKKILNDKLGLPQEVEEEVDVDEHDHH